MNDISNTRAKELHSGTYVEQYERKPISRVARLVPKMRLTPDTELADFACGNAMLLGEVHDKVHRYTGVDFSEEFIAAAKRRAQALGAGNCEFHCTDIISFCEANRGRFDVAAALDFTEHVRDAELIPILKGIRGSLKLGGLLYLHTPNLDFFMERMRDSGVILTQRPEHVAVRDAEQNIDVLLRAGFPRENIRVWLSPHYNLLRALDPLRHLPVVGKHFEARIFMECRC